MVSAELARHLAQISNDLRRQVGVLVSRDGVIRNVIVGDAAQLMLPDIGRLRGRTGRFRGLRLVHTHLKGEPLTADDLNDLALLRLDMVTMVEVIQNGQPGRVEAAYLDPSMLAVDDGVSTNGANQSGLPPSNPFLYARARNVQELTLDFESTITALEDEFARVARNTSGATGTERALVIGIQPDDDHLAETLELVRSAEVVMAGASRQRRRRIHPKTVVGLSLIHN